MYQRGQIRSNRLEMSHPKMKRKSYRLWITPLRKFPWDDFVVYQYRDNSFFLPQSTANKIAVSSHQDLYQAWMLSSSRDSDRYAEILLRLMTGESITRPRSTHFNLRWTIYKRDLRIVADCDSKKLTCELSEQCSIHIDGISISY